jgi:hypothetical protein
MAKSAEDLRQEDLIHNLEIRVSRLESALKELKEEVEKIATSGPPSGRPQ